MPMSEIEKIAFSLKTFSLMLKNAPLNVSESLKLLEQIKNDYLHCLEEEKKKAVIISHCIPQMLMLKNNQAALEIYQKLLSFLMSQFSNSEQLEKFPSVLWDAFSIKQEGALKLDLLYTFFEEKYAQEVTPNALNENWLLWKESMVFFEEKAEIIEGKEKLLRGYFLLLCFAKKIKTHLDFEQNILLDLLIFNLIKKIDLLNPEEIVDVSVSRQDKTFLDLPFFHGYWLFRESCFIRDINVLLSSQKKSVENTDAFIFQLTRIPADLEIIAKYPVPLNHLTNSVLFEKLILLITSKKDLPKLLKEAVEHFAICFSKEHDIEKKFEEFLCLFLGKKEVEERKKLQFPHLSKELIKNEGELLEKISSKVKNKIILEKFRGVGICLRLHKNKIKINLIQNEELKRIFENALCFFISEIDVICSGMGAGKEGNNDLFFYVSFLIKMGCLFDSAIQERQMEKAKEIVLSIEKILPHEKLELQKWFSRTLYADFISRFDYFDGQYAKLVTARNEAIVQYRKKEGKDCLYNVMRLEIEMLRKAFFDANQTELPQKINEKIFDINFLSRLKDFSIEKWNIVEVTTFVLNATQLREEKKDSFTEGFFFESIQNNFSLFVRLPCYVYGSIFSFTQEKGFFSMELFFSLQAALKNFKEAVRKTNLLVDDDCLTFINKISNIKKEKKSTFYSVAHEADARQTLSAMGWKITDLSALEMVIWLDKARCLCESEKLNWQMRFLLTDFCLKIKNRITTPLSESMEGFLINLTQSWPVFSSKETPVAVVEGFPAALIEFWVQQSDALKKQTSLTWNKVVDLLSALMAMDAKIPNFFSFLETSMKEKVGTFFQWLSTIKEKRIEQAYEKFLIAETPTFQRWIQAGISIVLPAEKIAPKPSQLSSNTFFQPPRPEASTGKKSKKKKPVPSPIIAPQKETPPPTLPAPTTTTPLPAPVEPTPAAVPTLPPATPLVDYTPLFAPGSSVLVQPLNLFHSVLRQDLSSGLSEPATLITPAYLVIPATPVLFPPSTESPPKGSALR